MIDNNNDNKEDLERMKKDLVGEEQKKSDTVLYRYNFEGSKTRR
jgi:hypothetical protein